MKIEKYSNNKMEFIDFVLNEQQKEIFDKLENGHTELYWSFGRCKGKSSFIYYYADYLATNKNRNVIIFCRDPYISHKIYCKNNYGSFLSSKKFECQYKNTVVKFIKSTENLRGHRFSETDVFFDSDENREMIYLCLDNTCNILLF